MNKILILLAIVFALFLHSCRARQVQPIPDVSVVAPVGELPTADEIILRSIEQRSSFDWFSANFSGNINIGGNRNNFGGQIRIKNGQQIWITVTAVGGFFEVARLKVTQDSVFLHNRIERTAMIRDHSFFSEMLGIDLTLNMLQDILVGNYFLHEGRLGSIILDFVFSDVHYRPLLLTVQDRENQNLSIDIRYSNYAIFNGYLFPQQLIIRVMNESTPIEAVLHYQRIQLNVPQNMPFSIPASAQRI